MTCIRHVYCFDLLEGHGTNDETRKGESEGGREMLEGRN